MTDKRFTECEYYNDDDCLNVNVIGYCSNPVRHKKIKGIALLHCQGSACELDTKDKWWGFGMTEKRFKSADEITIDLNELDIDIRKELVPISALKEYINSQMDYYEELRSKTDGSNYVSAMAHLDMLIKLKDWLRSQGYE